MFNYFHQNKARYEKGQVAPILILAIVILIIMAMVTLNIHKVAIDKTNSANSVDAGALAAGSVMANVFNAIASADAEMYKSYWLFYASVSGSMLVAIACLLLASSAASVSIASATTAIGLAMPTPCAAIVPATLAGTKATAGAGWMGMVTGTIWSMIISVNAFWAAQYYFYLKLRDAAEEGRESAIEQGHRFNFSNSGTSGKLPEEAVEGSSWSKIRKDFSLFVDDIKHNNYYKFDWQDGQARQHFVDSTVTTDELDTFDIIVTVLPWAAVDALLIYALVKAYAAKAALVLAAALYAAPLPAVSAVVALTKACVGYLCCDPIFKPACCATWIAMSAAAILLLTAGISSATTAIGLIPGIIVALAAVWVGLLPLYGVPIRDNNGWLALPFIICWIDDIVHDRLLKVESNQSQEQGDLGLWKAEYPDIYSFSLVDFKGEGEITPPDTDLRFDASIIQTDVIGNQ